MKLFKVKVRSLVSSIYLTLFNEFIDCLQLNGVCFLHCTKTHLAVSVRFYFSYLSQNVPLLVNFSYDLFIIYECLLRKVNIWMFLTQNVSTKCAHANIIIQFFFCFHCISNARWIIWLFFIATGCCYCDTSYPWAVVPTRPLQFVPSLKR